MNFRILLFIVSPVVLISCANNTEKTSDDVYVVSETRNDIKERDPELWEWLEKIGKKAAERRNREINSVDYMAEVNRAVTSVLEEPQISKNAKLLGRWKDCITAKYKNKGDKDWQLRGTSSIYTFNKDGTFRKESVNYSDVSCQNDEVPNTFWGANNGFYYIGEQLSDINGMEVYEINMIYGDREETKKYNEARVYFTVVGFKGDELLFGSRNGPGNMRTPEGREITLDKPEFVYNRLSEK